MWSHGKFHWNELMTRDVEKAKKFYAVSLGWTYETVIMDEQGTEYHIAKIGEEMAGGLYEMKGPEYEGVPDRWFTYIAVDDVDARIKTALENGGVLESPIVDLPEVGRMGVVKDPCGAVSGWMTPDE